MLDEYPKSLRIDPLTGVGNPLAFFEWLLSHTQTKPTSPFTLISLDIRNLSELNESHGRAAGDAALRWAALVLLEETAAEVYRISADEFVGVLTQDATEERTALGEKVKRRLAAEAEQVKLEPPAAMVAMIHYSGLEQVSPEDVLGVVYGALVEVKQEQDQSFKVFDAVSSIPAASKSGLINDMVKRMVSLGSMLDRSHSLAYSDSITGLPNMHAAVDACNAMIELHASSREGFAILLIDGDDLGRYNKIGYLAGDEMIQRLGQVLTGEIRPSDFLARWRTGDEFLVLLDGCSLEDAASMADRVRRAVMEASQTWILPITVSIGIAGFPDHGDSMEDLLHQSELALKQAKTSGKNQVVVSSA